MFARSQDPNGFDHIITEIKLLAQSVRESKQESAHLRLAFEQTTQKIDSLVQTTKGIEESQEFLSKQFDALQQDFNGFKKQVCGLQRENERIRTEVAELKYSQGATSSRLDQLEMEMDKVNRGVVANNAIILGIPVQEDENVKTLVIKLGSVVGCSLEENNIISAHRLFGKNRSNQSAPILVSFSSAAIKEQLSGRSEPMAP
nr:uncharacterized protein LOC115264881 [Aedes albopictus]XP_029724778.1 uncharacterized protein LOC115264882 [Aedes albopictus]